jgi:hypothetical protein
LITLTAALSSSRRRASWLRLRGMLPLLVLAGGRFYGSIVVDP